MHNTLLSHTVSLAGLCKMEYLLVMCPMVKIKKKKRKSCYRSPGIKCEILWKESLKEMQISLFVVSQSMNFYMRPVVYCIFKYSLTFHLQQPISPPIVVALTIIYKLKTSCFRVVVLIVLSFSNNSQVLRKHLTGGSSTSSPQKRSLSGKKKVRTKKSAKVVCSRIVLLVSMIGEKMCSGDGMCMYIRMRVCLCI